MKIKKKTVIIAIATILVVGISFGVIHYQKVEAERIAQEEQDAKLEKEKEDLDKAKKSVDEAYKMRKEEDIKTAETAVSKLSNNQKEDKKSLTDKLTKLIELLSQLDEVNKQLSKTEKSQSQSDIDDSQKLIDKVTDDYLKKDKELAQKKLDEIKTKLSKENEQAETAKKEALIAQERNEATTQAEAYQSAQLQMKVHKVEEVMFKHQRHQQQGKIMIYLVLTVLMVGNWSPVGMIRKAPIMLMAGKLIRAGNYS